MLISKKKKKKIKKIKSALVTSYVDSYNENNIGKKSKIKNSSYYKKLYLLWAHIVPKYRGEVYKGIFLNNFFMITYIF